MYKNTENESNRIPLMRENYVYLRSLTFSDFLIKKLNLNIH